MRLTHLPSHLYLCGAVDNTGRHGVAVALSEVAQAALLAWVPISPRLASTCLKGATVNLPVVAVYAPTLDEAEEVQGSYYDGLQDAIDSASLGTSWLWQGTGTQGLVQRHCNTVHPRQVCSRYEVR